MKEAAADHRAMERTMTIDEVAEVLQVSRRTVQKLMYEGAIRYQRVGGQIRFKRTWVEKYLDD